MRAETSEEMIRYIDKGVDELGKGGGMFSTIFGGDEKIVWDGIEELYCYSREYYEK
jgi:hypothetical protein